MPEVPGFFSFEKLKRTIAARISASPVRRLTVGATPKNSIPIVNGKTSALWVIPQTAPL
ncbi:hypothetical protein [Victivallis lenta]|uniref:hypothetical protein n=1 Tax=Victivallis lenta TaxID=2606640 RepID=UPI0023535504|nr:hypothetical protein [Victivallis lenta]